MYITPPGGILPSDLRFCRAPCLHRQTTFVTQLCLASGFACSPFFLLHLVLSFLFMRASSCLVFFHVMACWTWIVPPLSQDQPCLFKEHLVHLSYSSNNIKLGEHKYVFSKNSCPKIFLCNKYCLACLPPKGAAARGFPSQTFLEGRGINFLFDLWT